MKKIFLFILFIFYSVYFYAQPDTLNIRPIYINSTFTEKNQFIEQIDSSLLQQKQTNQLSDLIQLTTPVFIKSFGNFGVSTASFRGTSASHTQVFWNDIPLNSPMLGQTDFSLIPVFIADEINISAGIGSLANSDGALGGNIMLKTTSKWDKKTSLSIGQNIGSFSNYSTFLKFSSSSKKILFDSRIIYKKGVNDFIFYNNALPDANMQKLENANFNQLSFLQQIFFRINKNNIISFHFWHSNSYRNIPPIMSYEGLYRIENQNNGQNIGVVKFSSKINQFKINISSSISHKTLNYFLADSILGFPENTNIIKSKSNSYETGFINSIKINYNISDKTNIETNLKSYFYKVETFDSATYTNSGYEAKRLKNNANIILNYNFNNYFKTILVLSETTIYKNFFIPNISIGFVNEPIHNETFTWGVNLGRNQHIPTLNDLYWQPGGNPLLKPERGFSADAFLSSKITNKKTTFDFKIKPFAALIKDWIIWQPSEFHYWTAQNLKKVFSRGFEAGIVISKTGKISYKLISNYSLTITTDESNTNNEFATGKQLIYIPKNTLNTFIIINYLNFEFSTSFNFTDKRFTSSSNNLYTLPSYKILNASFSKLFNNKKTNFKIEFNLNNILNEQYQAILYRPMPGINYEIKLLLFINPHYS
ncbi:MAG: TonB-dependent receptor plug domain-containing protein [Bacteroidales bacterium]|nr:TonB-dependent receptor plug domain-containing protein [Bacteroidales bacterium]